MINSSNFVKKSKKAINDELRRNFVLASSDDTFKKLCKLLYFFIVHFILKRTAPISSTDNLHIIAY